MTRWMPPALAPALAMALALIGAVLASQVPAPRPADAEPRVFSAGRAMADVEAIAREPHPVGSAEHARVRAYLFERMTRLGLRPEIQTGRLSPASIQRLGEWRGDPDTGDMALFNLIGVLPGRDRAAPAVVLMAHYDSAWGSPGAADDSTGVAAVLETVRALRARGGGERDLIVLLTDSEELNLDGARAFFSEHPLRDRIGAVVNLEARGGGGRAMMFETGPNPSETIALFAGAARRADGGATSNSLAAFVYAAMPNGTDFTLARDRGLAGVNLAFIGRPDQYHSPASTPAALDRGSVQHIGAQALETTDVLLNAPQLPAADRAVVHADIPGLGIIAHAQATGWLILAAALILTALAAWGEQRRSGREPGALGRGLLRGLVAGLWFVAVAAVAAQAVRTLGGPLELRGEAPGMYYTLLRRLPWMEAGVGLAVLAAALLLFGGRDAAARRALALGAVVLTLIAGALGGFTAPLLIMGVAGVALSLALPRPAAGLGEAIGLVLLVLALGAGLQAVAPVTAFLLLWPGLLAAAAVAAHALLAQRTANPWLRAAPLVLAASAGGAWLLYLAHPVFLGVGMDLPAAVVALALPFAALMAPLAPGMGQPRRLAMAALACLVLGVGLSLTGRLAEPLPPPSAGGPT